MTNMGDKVTFRLFCNVNKIKKYALRLLPKAITGVKIVVYKVRPIENICNEYEGWIKKALYFNANIKN